MVLDMTVKTEREEEFNFSAYSAVIFDLDGTLVHSEHAWEAAKLEVAHSYGLAPSRAVLDAYIGRGLAGFISEIFGQDLTPAKLREIGNQMGAAADKLLPAMREPIPGASELLCTLHEQGMRIAVCSSSPRRHIVGALEMLEISHRIEAIISAADLPRGKPDPLPYTATLEALKLPATSTCAFEDSLPGAQSANAAGIAVLAVGAGCTASKFSFCHAQAEDFGLLLAEQAQRQI